LKKGLLLKLCFIIGVKEDEIMGLFGPEKMILMLEKYDFKPGDVIKGTVKIQLKKPMNARRLEVGLLGRRIQQQSSVHMGSGGVHHSKQTNYMTVYDFKIPLDSEKEYQQGTYPFEIKIPPNILQSEPELQGTAATAINVIKALTGGVSSRIEWSVVGRLDLPMKIDVSVSQKIIIS
jgi:hypothetical protein